MGRQISAAQREGHPLFCVWRGDGKEILYNSGEGQIWSVAVDPARGQFARAVPLFRVRWPSFVAQSRLMAVTRDGSRILAVQTTEQPGSEQIDILADWTAAMK
jgi:hypothetical protein